MGDAAAERPTYDAPLTRCPLCAASRLRRYDHDFRGHRIDRCAGCGVLVMNPQYSDAWLERFYSTYISVHDGEPVSRWRSRPEVRTAAKRRSLELVARHGGRGRILMVGCGDGLELGIAQELGWQPEGYDVDPETTAEVAARYGVPVHSGRFEDLALPEEAYDSMFLDQVIEHPKDPGVFLRAAQRILRPGGVLYLGLPNIGSIANRWKTWLGRLGLKRAKRGKHYASKHHIFYYSPKVMRRLLTDHYGFDVVEVCGSLKPDSNPIKPLFARRFPLLDSSFVLVAKKRATSAIR